MNSIRIVADYCRQCLPLKDARLNESYFYKSLTFCVIDAVFSIRAKYETTMATVERYCKYFDLIKVREDRNVLPAIGEQQPVRDLVQEMKSTGAECFADYVFQNRQRTSARSGILKSEAVMRFATVLETFGVNYLQDVEKIMRDDAFEVAIREIPGQGSGIVMSYFFMLAGSDDLIKPDTHVMNFLTDAHRAEGIEPRISLQDAQIVLSQACKILKSEYAHLTPRLLDNAIWSYQRKQNTRQRHGNYKKEKAKMPRIDLVQNRPMKGDVFRGRINDLSLIDGTGWRRRDISFVKCSLHADCLTNYPAPGKEIVLLDTEGNRYITNFTEPSGNTTICIGKPSRIKAWYKMKGYDDYFISPDTWVYFRYTGNTNEFEIFTESEYRESCKIR